MKVALAQLNLLLADLDGAASAIRAAATEAKANGAQFIVFPELVTLGGYPPRDLLDRDWLINRKPPIMPR